MTQYYRPMNYYNEFDAKAAHWLQTLVQEGMLPYGYVDQRNISEVKPNELRHQPQCHLFAGIGGWPYALQLAGVPEDFQVWTASLPCQPFSAAGKRCGTDDKRHLWPVFHELVAANKPPLIFGEQVASKLGRAWLAAVQADLEALGYFFNAADLCAAGIGAPHIRQRLYWCAIRQQGELPGADFNGVPEVVEERFGAGGLGNTGSQRRQQVARGAPCDEAADGGAGRDGRESDSDYEPRGTSEDRFGDGGLGVANSAGREPGRTATKAAGHGDTVESASSVGGLAYRRGAGLEVVREQPAREECATTKRGCAAGWPDDVVYLPCADGKARPCPRTTEPSPEPLVDGVSEELVRSGYRILAPLVAEAKEDADKTNEARVMRLKGYGNAIVPQLAALFIRSVMECLAE